MLSPLLANVVLHSLDRQWLKHHWRLGVLVRYADDLVILCPTKERAEAALAILEAILAQVGLKLAQAKTRLVDLREHGEGFDFLGFHHRRIKSRRTGRYFCARWPSKRVLQAARAAINARTERRRLLLPVEAVVEDLNRFLIGWRNYYRFGNSSRAFAKLDWHSHHRLALFISKKHGRGRVFAWRLMPNTTISDLSG